ncbi:C-type lectin domain family 17, member A [Drosophila tropicalis]|uniref:C-type lectin domain family 17, member A n=1 Tax=Drosophila tropicalis TaxID=46794 RepID=UPI0035ABF896
MLLLLVVTYLCSFQLVHSNSTEPIPIITKCAPFSNCDEHYAVAGFAKVNWFQANHICNSAGLVLATVNNWEQHLDLLRSVANTGNILGDKRFWLAATNKANNKGPYRTWTWLSTGKPMTFKLWAKKEPKSERLGNDACLTLDLDKRWHSANCENQNYFICEKICTTDSNRFREIIYI